MDLWTATLKVRDKLYMEVSLNTNVFVCLLYLLTPVISYVKLHNNINCYVNFFPHNKVFSR